MLVGHHGWLIHSLSFSPPHCPSLFLFSSFKTLFFILQQTIIESTFNNSIITEYWGIYSGATQNFLGRAQVSLCILLSLPNQKP
jgi:hypothetical protein